ncbi:MAG: FAD-dependent thymidylate synthase [Candidatus Pelethousia sp.]|nr:FAD-dependent thymidylate synthase [Candidatus Pelethousia sp.]
MAEKKLCVRLLWSTPDPTRAAALGGRLCYSDTGIAQLYEDMEAESEGFVEKLMRLGHLSPIEHASFTFGVEGVSRALLAQITRHRIASFSVQSQRYVAKEQLDFILPPSIAALGPDAADRFLADMEAAFAAYTRWRDLGIPAEDARFVLPNAAETRMLITMNARELLHFFSLRCCMRAQWEIRRLAWCMLGIARREAPALFQAAGPGCQNAGCTEGRMSCGEAARMQALSRDLSAYVAEKPTDEAIENWVLKRL